MAKLSADEPGTQILLGLLKSGAFKPILNAKLPPDADPLLVERQKAARALQEAHDQGADLDELDRLGDRLLQVCNAVQEAGLA